MEENKNRIRLELVEVDAEQISEIVDEYPEITGKDLFTLAAFSADVLERDESNDELYRSADDIYQGVVLRGEPAWESKEVLKASLERLAAQGIADKAHRVWGIEGGRIRKEEVYLLDYQIYLVGGRERYEEDEKR